MSTTLQIALLALVPGWQFVEARDVPPGPWRSYRAEKGTFACNNPRLRHSPNSNRALLRLSAIFSQYRFTVR